MGAGGGEWFKALLQLANFTLGPDATPNTETAVQTFQQEASSQKKTSDEEEQIIFGICFPILLGSRFLKEARFTPETLTVSLSKLHPLYETLDTKLISNFTAVRAFLCTKASIVRTPDCTFSVEVRVCLPPSKHTTSRRCSRRCNDVVCLLG